MGRLSWDLKTPVVLMIFNRPETTHQVFEAVRAVRPRQLLVVADGPRPLNQGEVERCRETRAIIESVDWDCQVLTNYSSENLGCMRRVSSGLDWVFQEVDEAIILEDDCLPHPSFFRYCSELLEYYRNESQIAQICGANFQFNRCQLPYSYYFSRYNHIWGWASWKRAWESHDNEMTDWPDLRKSKLLENILSGKKETTYWTDVLDRVYAGEIDTWDCRWTLSCWKNRMLSVIPSVNLVSNIGFGPGATHTPVPNRYASMETESIAFPLCHPSVIEVDSEADDYTGKTMFRTPTMTDRIINRFRRHI